MRAAPHAFALVSSLAAACLLPGGAAASRSAAQSPLVQPAAQRSASTVTVYRCTGADGRVTLRDTPCAKGQQQEARSMLRPGDAPARRVGDSPPGSDADDAGDATPRPQSPPPLVVVRTMQPMYECTTPDNQQYTSDSPEGNPRWVPMWTLGWPVAAGTWVRDPCRALPQAETCARLRDRRDEIDRRFFNAMPSERARLDVEERGLLARLGSECPDR